MKRRRGRAHNRADLDNIAKRQLKRERKEERRRDKRKSKIEITKPTGFSAANVYDEATGVSREKPNRYAIIDSDAAYDGQKRK